MTLLNWGGVGGGGILEGGAFSFFFFIFIFFIGAMRSEFFLLFSSPSSLNVTLQVWYRPCGSLVVTGSLSQV